MNRKIPEITTLPENMEAETAESRASSLHDALGVELYQIRLLQLHADEFDSVISCSLEKVSLLNPGSYTALSYCWGDPDITVEVLVNGQSINVTVNLEAALRRLRAMGISRVWVDALCINQSDS